MYRIERRNNRVSMRAPIRVGPSVARVPARRAPERCPLLRSPSDCIGGLTYCCCTFPEAGIATRHHYPQRKETSISRIKPTLTVTVATAATLAASTACTQSNVTLYGLIGTTVSAANNTNATGTCTTDLQVSWFSGSHWGLADKENLGDGMSVIFRLELEFEMPINNMNTPGMLFNHDA